MSILNITTDPAFLDSEVTSVITIGRPDDHIEVVGYVDGGILIWPCGSDGYKGSGVALDCESTIQLKDYLSEHVMERR